MARVDLTYPKIPSSAAAPLEQCIAFEKYDGTNLHWVWERGSGWSGFGTRRNRYSLTDTGVQEFDAAHPRCVEAVELFTSDLAMPLSEILSVHPAYRVATATVFTEYFGTNSFAGQHTEGDPKKLVLFDVQAEQSLILPQQFVADFSELPIARVVYQGKLTGRFAEAVRAGRYGVNEGVVCKGGKTSDTLWMAKIKTHAYLERLQKEFQDEWKAYWE